MIGPSSRPGPINSAPEPTPADWGFKVSVCIAVLCNEKRSIVTVSDEKITFGNFSADHAVMKVSWLNERWAALYAGNDVEHAGPIVNRSWQLLRGQEDLPDDGEAIANAVDQAYGERLSREVANRVLRKRGFDVDGFRDHGKAKCTPSVYLSLCSRIDQVSLSLKFLVCGFTKDNDGHIYCVDGESAPKCYDHVGMWAVGSGAYAAMSSLAFRADRQHLNTSTSVEEAVYFALEAKFMAESSGDVGKEGVFVMILDSDSNQIRSMMDTDSDKIKEIWKKEAVPRVPGKLAERIAPLIWSPRRSSLDLEG